VLQVGQVEGLYTDVHWQMHFFQITEALVTSESVPGLVSDCAKVNESVIL
jgi:hypothetical protein